MPKFFSEGRIIDLAVVNQCGWLERIEQWLKNVDQTHLILTCGKPVLQKLYKRGHHPELWLLLPSIRLIGLTEIAKL